MSDANRTPQPTGSSYQQELPLPHELQELLGGKYVVEGFLGQGGMGAVYKGLQLQLHRPVAIKILAKRGEGDDFAFEQRFKREARAMATLTHPNIVKVYDCGDAGENYLFMCMELVEGGDLSGAIMKGRVTPEVALALIGPICDGLHAAHARGLVHRDIKPANIFLTADGKPKVADFGLAKTIVGKGTLLTKAGMGMGTPDYAAPEQFEGLSDVDHRADIYSVGVMFYQMLTGNLPRGAFRGPSHRVAIDPRLDDAVFKAMEQDRNARYQSVVELKADVEHILATWMQGEKKKMTLITPAPDRAPAAVVARPPTQVSRTQTPKKSGAGMMIGVLGTLAVIAVGAFFMMKKEKKTGAVSAPRDLVSSSVAGTSASDSTDKVSVTPVPASAQPASATVATPNASSGPAASASAAPATAASSSDRVALVPETASPASMAKPDSVAAPATAQATPAAAAAPSVASTPPPPSALPDGTHHWTDIKARTIQAKFVRLQGDTVTLLMAGREFPIPMSTLSAESQKQASDLSAQASPP